MQVCHGGLLTKHICGKKSNITSETADTVNLHFSHYKSMGTISSYSTGIKKHNFYRG